MIFKILVFNILTICSVLLMWMCLFIVFTGIGSIVHRIWKWEMRSTEQLFLSFWIGWAHTIFFLQIWHLFFPVDGRSTILISLIGMVGFWDARRNGRWQLNPPQAKIFSFIIVLLGLGLAYRACLAYWNYDSGLYHLNFIQWAGTFPVIPGLGNLHGRLAFNSSYFLYVSMLDVGFWKHKSAYLANGILVWVFLGQVLFSWLKIIRSKDNVALYDIFCALLILPVFLIPDILVNISSPTPDLPVILVTMLIYASCVRLLETGEASQTELLGQFFAVVMYSVLGIIIKLNFFMFGICTLLLSCFSLRKRNSMVISRDRNALLKIFLGSAVVIVIWMVRGVILSGYIAYPFPWGSIPVDWRLPQASVLNMANWTYAWARKPKVHHWSEVLGNWNWINEWGARVMANPYVLAFPLLLAIACLLLILFFKYARKQKFSEENFGFLLLPPGAAIIFWFFTAPDPRFGAIFAWILGITSFAFFIRLTNKAKKLTIIPVLAFVLWQVVMGVGVNTAPDILKNFKGNVIPAFRKPSIINVWSTLSKENLELHNAPQVPLKAFTTRSGLFIYVPEEGDQCWDAPLPCSVYARSDLRLRDARSMRYGFVIDPKNDADVAVGMHDRW